jgi:hypothetical protein
MKRTLRFTCLVLTTLVMGLAAKAQQRAIPLSVTLNAPTQGEEIAYDQNYSAVIRVENLSQTETLLASDTLLLLLEGEPDFAYNENFMVISALQNIAPGGSALYGIFINGNLNDTGVPIPKEYCVTACGFGNFYTTGAWYNAVADPFALNCKSFKLMPQEGGNPTSVTELDATAFSIYPNPANEAINISTENMPADAIITVHNAMGQRVFEQKANDFRAMGAINTSGWNSGVYMVSVTSNGASTTQRVTVQH